VKEKKNRTRPLYRYMFFTLFLAVARGTQQLGKLGACPDKTKICLCRPAISGGLNESAQRPLLYVFFYFSALEAITFCSFMKDDMHVCILGWNENGLTRGGVEKFFTYTSR
jgi:hypothetical protein